MKSYETVTEAINDLKARGYKLDFNLAFDKLICHENGVCLNPAEFEISEVHRFEGDTNPSDEDVVYAITSRDGSIKGVLSAAYGMYADGVSSEMLQKMNVQPK